MIPQKWQSTETEFNYLQQKARKLEVKGTRPVHTYCVVKISVSEVTRSSQKTGLSKIC